MQPNKSNVVILAKNHVMEYAWGRSNQNCIISELVKEEHPKYAQLWMGTHPNGPSKITADKTLLDYLQENDKKQLSFLFKVLNIEKCLSLQLHPNKMQAEKLHATKPNLYPDSNDKPEMFYTLSQFECFIGFIDKDSLSKLMSSKPFSSLKSGQTLEVKPIISELLSLPSNQICQMIANLTESIESVLPDRVKVIKKLNEQYPNDVGILISCLLQYKVIEPYKCYGLQPGVSHSYINGDCIEVMRNSDNVVRLGLTPKVKDAQTMLEIINDTLGFSPLEITQKNGRFSWNNYEILALKSQKTQILQFQLHGDSIGIVFDGNFIILDTQTHLKKGSIIFIEKGKYKVQGSGVIYVAGSHGCSNKDNLSSQDKDIKNRQYQ